MNKTNILFLDFDGVLNSHRSLWKKFAEWFGVEWKEDDFDIEKWYDKGHTEDMNPDLWDRIDEAEVSKKPEIGMPDLNMDNWPPDEYAILALNKIVEENNAKVVICSTWRKGRTISQLQKILDGWGAKCEVIGITPYKNKLSYDATRASEILEWLVENNSMVNRICILDDEAAYDINFIFEKWCVQEISGRTHGLREDHIPLAKKCFEIPIDPLYDFEKFYPMPALQKYRHKAQKK